MDRLEEKNALVDSLLNRFMELQKKKDEIANEEAGLKLTLRSALQDVGGRFENEKFELVYSSEYQRRGFNSKALFALEGTWLWNRIKKYVTVTYCAASFRIKEK
jgi:hypothetical protein